MFEQISMKDEGEIVTGPQQVQVLDYLRARSCCPSPFGKGGDTMSNKHRSYRHGWEGVDAHAGK